MSTFSPNLRLENISTGTQAGAWGNTTNTNICSLLEGAVSGYTTVSVTTANQALTALYGAPDESRNAMLRLTTTTTAAFAVYAPPAPKEYTIYNNTSYVATIYNGLGIGSTTAAGTGVAIPAGKTMTVWSNGTNFLQQNTHLIAPTLDAPAMTGIPTAPTAVAATNTTQVATTAFVQAIAALALNTLLPIGSIYTNATDATNPGTLLGFGTWVTFGGGLVPVGYLAGSPLPFGTGGTSGSLGGTGGFADSVVVSHTHTATTTLASTTHTHSGTTSTDPGHTHALTLGDNNNDNLAPAAASNGVVVAPTGTTQTAGSHSHTMTTGNNSVTPTASTSITAEGVTGVNQNYQPYITVYMWRRTA